MRLNRLFVSLLIIVPTIVAADLSITENRTIVCNTNGGQGTVGGSCPANQSSNPTIVDKIEAAKAKGSGNPINVLNGNKFEQATDIQAVGDDYALRLNRYYNSRSSQRGLFGIGWRHDYEMQLQDIDDQIDIIQADGRKISFTKTAAALDSSTLFVTRYVADKSELGYIERSQSSNPSKATWIWTLPTGKQFEFVIHKQINSVNQLGMSRYGQLSRVTEQANSPSSPYWSLTYGVDGKLAQVRNHNGDTLKFAYEITKSGLPKISVTSSTIRQNNSNNNNSASKWVYLLDQKGNLAQVVSPTGVRTGYQYNDPYDAHNLTAKYSYENKQPQLITKWTYDAYDRATSSTHKDGVKKVSVVYDNDTVIPTQANHIFTNVLTNSIGETTNYRYRYKNGEAQLLSVTGAGCVTCGPTNVSYEYDSAGRVTKTSKLDDNGQVIASTSTSYDTIGRTIKITQTDKTKEDNQQTWLAYSYDNAAYPMQPTAITRPSVVEGKISQTSLTYDEAGNVVAMTESGFRPATVNSQVQPISRTTRYRYETINGRQQLVAADGPLKGNQDTTRYQYDKQNQLTLISYPEGLTQSMRYDTQGRVVSLVNIDGTKNEYQYDAQGQVIQSNQAGQVSTISYDPLGRIQQITDPLGQIMSYQYDAGGQIIGMSDGKQTQIDLTRDTEGNLTSANLLVDGKVEQQTAFAQEESVDTSLESETLEFSVATRKLKDKNGDSTTAYFDDFNRVIAENSPTTGWTRYEWNNDDSLTEVANELAQKINITYDGFGRIIEIRTNDDSAKVVWGDYNQKKSVIGPDYQLHYAYDQLGNISKKTWQFKDNNFTAHYKYNDNQQLTTVDYPSGLSLNYKYNEDGQLNQITQKSWFKDRVLVSNINDKKPYDNQSTFNFGNGVSQTQAYRNNEVVEWTGNKDVAYSYSTLYKGGYAIDYAYPNISTRPVSTSLNSIDNQVSSDMVESQPSKAMTQTTTTTDQYNVIGQLVRESGRHYRYDDLGRLKQVTDNKSPIVTYDYLITGERYKKTVLNSDQAKQTTYYLYDNGVLISEFTQTATEDKPKFIDYVHYDNRPLLQFNELKPFYLTTDHRGAVMAVTDDNKDIVWQAKLADNGKATVFNGSQIAMNLRGSNQYYDAEIALHYNIHRYFSPTRNQYLTPDPVGLAAGEDLYAFANDRPHEFVDLWGLQYEVYDEVLQRKPFLERAFIGIITHKRLTTAVRAAADSGVPRLEGYGADDGREGTFGIIRPDAYFVDEENIELEGAGKPFVGTIWELKPISWKNDPVRYKKGLNQVKSYINAAKNNCKATFKGGSYSSLPYIKSVAGEIALGNKVYSVTTHADTKVKGKADSGLVFYDATLKSQRTAEKLPESASKPEMSDSQKSQLQKAVDAVKDAASADGWQGILVKGLLIFLALVLAFFLAKLVAAVFAGAVAMTLAKAIAAVIALLTASAAIAKDGVKDDDGKHRDVGLLEALKTAFGIDISKESIKAYASKKWDQTTDWVKGWFK
ncbi:DUF6531 domain-containing protein [Psychrobacter sp. APC 3279]|uniref:DUF6531 domain-containing protein n=1 Tax=Psychrobacter sp. APC 3279 TaxID=3035189 RepID=UPI0025B382D3|nr:DUF6531 domain-containing protein [Psychrobacter sp. APC 3279]MDN3442643.1 DUF6531 domain-containing protein [Psychrobacter sp. APC 3279]